MLRKMRGVRYLNVEITKLSRRDHRDRGVFCCYSVAGHVEGGRMDYAAFARRVSVSLRSTGG